METLLLANLNGANQFIVNFFSHARETGTRDLIAGLSHTPKENGWKTLSLYASRF